jgi:hypothetical protein
VVDLSKTFTFCMHCKNRTMEPRHVCPNCDWPRQHSEETPPPDISLAGPNTAPIVPAPQGGQPVVVPHLADVKIDSRPVVVPGQAPARLEAIADLGDISEQARPAAILRSLTLAPDDPLPEEPVE